MRFVAIALNTVLLATTLYLLATQGAPTKSGTILLVFLCFAAPLSSLLVLYLIRSSESWLGLYLKRKMLEEKKKIEKLEDSQQ